VLLADDHLQVTEAPKSLMTIEFDLAGVVEDRRGGSRQPEGYGRTSSSPTSPRPTSTASTPLVRLGQGGDQVPVVSLTMHRDVTFARRAFEAASSNVTSRSFVL
jgi:hypothetical protein